MSYVEKHFYDEKSSYIGFYEGEINISKDSNYIDFYLINHNVDIKSIQKIKNQINSESVSILMQISVAKDFIGQGQGKEILKQFLINVKGDCILICYGDIPNGSLKDWYEYFGFEVISTETSDLIMIKRK